MSGAPVDRRVRRTRRRLKTALAELIHERKYEGLTVREIAERADVGRSTFYAHFESKEDLLFAGVERHVLEMAREPGRGSDGSDVGAGGGRSPAGAARLRFSLPLLRHIRTHRHFFETTVLGGSEPRVREICEGIVARAVETEMRRTVPEDGAGSASRTGATARELEAARVRAVVGAFMGIVGWWLRRADHVPPETVDEIVQEWAGVVLPAPGAPP